MARTKSPRPTIRFPQRTDPRPLLNRVDEEEYPLIEREFSLFPIDDTTVTMIPASYDDGWDRRADCESEEGPAAWRAWKTCVL